MTNMNGNLLQHIISILPSQKHKRYTVTSPNTDFTNKIQIDILDSTGNEISGSTAQKLAANAYEVNLTALPIGVYHLRVLDGETYFIKRIILQ